MPNESHEVPEDDRDRQVAEEPPAEAGSRGDAAGNDAAGDDTAGGEGDGHRGLGVPEEPAAEAPAEPAAAEAAHEEPAYGEPPYEETAYDPVAAEPPPPVAPSRRVPVQGDPSAEASFGTWLRRQREMREIDLREIADKTKISLRYLKAMEQDRFDILPAPVFARGFLREYSRYVGLNPDDVVNYYLAAHEGADGADDDVVPMTAASRGPVSKRFLVVLLAVLLLAVCVYAYFYQRSRANREEAAPPPIAAPAGEQRETPPEPVPEPIADLPAGAPLVVTLDFTQKCWVAATVDGGSRTEKLFVAGESLQLEARERVVLETLGNASGVEVQVNGVPRNLPPGGADGAVRNVIIEAPGAPRTGTAPPRRAQPTTRPPTPPPVTESPQTGSPQAGTPRTEAPQTGTAPQQDPVAPPPAPRPRDADEPAVGGVDEDEGGVPGAG